MTTHTLLDWFTVLVLFALVASPAALGYARDRRIDRQLARAERSATATGARSATRSARVGYSRAA